MQEVQKALSKFAKQVIKESKSNMTRGKRNASRDLYNSLKYELDVHKNSFSLTFFMEDYGKFVDRGVSGVKNKYNTPFSYKTKMPPSKVFDKWIKQRGIKGRDKKGRFITNKSLSFLIARSIFNKGIKPSMFFTKPFERAFKKLPNEVAEKFGLEVEEMLNKALKFD